MRARVQAEEAHARENDNDADTYRLEYMNKVAAAVKAFRIEALAGLSVPTSFGYRSNGHDTYTDFLRKVDYVTLQIRILSVQSNREGSVGLDDTAKAKIHFFIKGIRDAIGQAETPDDKRDALYSKLNKFAAEVDRARTSLQAVAAVYIAVCDAIGQGFDKLEPARKFIDSIAGLMGGFKASEDRADNRLPAPQERKRLEPPPERLPSPPSAGPIDDDIPF